MPRQPKNGNGKRKYLNLWLTEDSYKRAVELADERGSKRSELVYPLVLEYLYENAPSLDLVTVKDRAAIAKDRYWGTISEVRTPRVLPSGLKRGLTAKGQKLLQQSLAPADLKHLRDIERYYRVTVADLMVAALNAKCEGSDSNNSQPA